MPELPDVEGFRRAADDLAVGHTIAQGRGRDDVVCPDEQPAP